MDIQADGRVRRHRPLPRVGRGGVLIGRATLYGLIAGGEPGVRRAIEILTMEIDRALGQLGVRSLDELGPHLLKKSNGSG